VMADVLAQMGREDLAAVPLDAIAYLQFTDALQPESRQRLIREKGFSFIAVEGDRIPLQTHPHPVRVDDRRSVTRFHVPVNRREDLSGPPDELHTSTGVGSDLAQGSHTQALEDDLAARIVERDDLRYHKESGLPTHPLARQGAQPLPPAGPGLLYLDDCIVQKRDRSPRF